MSAASREGHLSSYRKVAQVQELFCPQFTCSCHNAAKPTLFDRQTKGLQWWSFWGCVNVPPKQLWITRESVQSCNWFQIHNSSENKHQICSFLLTVIFQFALGNIPCRIKKGRAWACCWQSPFWLHFKSLMPMHRRQSYLSIPFKYKTSKANLTPNLFRHIC